jgi:glycosyltransferase involved in cell wall biosynthesis
MIDRETGLLVRGTDVGELAAVIQDLASSPEKRHALGIAGRERVCRAFTWERVAADVSAVHLAVASRDHRATRQ